MAERRGFQVVEDDSDPDEYKRPPTKPPNFSADHTPALNILLLALKSLSQRAIAALADLFFLSTVFSAFWLWQSIPEPNAFQIVSLTVYAAFVLAANFIVRRH